MQLSQHWRETAIERSEVVTDAWEITKVWAGRFAEWVLFLCMVVNIIEILPGVQVALWTSNLVLGIQAVTLDVAGFGLATMAAYAKQQGDEATANRAKITAWVLIGIMLVTVLSVAVGGLWPELHSSTQIADKVLILVRVGMTVVYGHVIHSLRRQPLRMVSRQALEEHLARVEQRLAESSEGVHQMSQAMTGVRQQIAQLPQPLNYLQLAERMVPLLPQPEPVNYVQLAEQIVPLLPQPEPVNLDGIFTEVLTELERLQAQKEQAVSDALLALQATVERLTKERSSVEPEPGPLVPEKQTNGTVARPVLSVVPVERGTGNEVATFIGTFVEREGRVPTLTEIMDATGCSKSTASRNRTKLLGEQTA